MGEDTTFDPEAFRRFERDGWTRLHRGYHRLWHDLTTQVVPALLDAANIGPGQRVLDVACGPGYVAEAAAARGAEAVGVDLAGNMVALAAARCPELLFEAADAEALPYPQERFDAVLINFGLLHFPDADRALAEAHRVLKPGGRLAFTNWAYAKTSAIVIASRAIARHGSMEVDLPEGTPAFRFAEPDECQRVLGGLGFAEVASQKVALTWRLPAPDALMDCFRQATARTSGLLAAQDPADLPAIEAAMTEACAPFARDGQTDLPMPAMLTAAVKG